MTIFIGSRTHGSAIRLFNQAHAQYRAGQFEEAFKLFDQALQKYQLGYQNIIHNIATKSDRGTPSLSILKEQIFVVQEIAVIKFYLLQTDSIQSMEDFLKVADERKDIHLLIQEAQSLLDLPELQNQDELNERSSSLKKDLCIDELKSIIALKTTSLRNDEDETIRLTILQQVLARINIDLNTDPQLFLQASAVLFDKISECYIRQGERAVAQEDEHALELLEQAQSFISRSIDDYHQIDTIESCYALHLSYLYACELQAELSGDKEYSERVLAYIRRHDLLTRELAPIDRMELLDGFLKAARHTGSVSGSVVIGMAEELKTLCESVGGEHTEETRAFLTLATSFLPTQSPSLLQKRAAPVSVEELRSVIDLTQEDDDSYLAVKRVRVQSEAPRALFFSQPTVAQPRPLVDNEAIKSVFRDFFSRNILSNRSATLFLSISADALHPNYHRGLNAHQHKSLDLMRTSLYGIALKYADAGTPQHADINKAKTLFEKGASSARLKQLEALYRNAQQSPQIAFTDHQTLLTFLEKEFANILDEIDAWFEDMPEVRYQVLKNYLENLVRKLKQNNVFDHTPVEELQKLEQNLRDVIASFTPSPTSVAAAAAAL